MISALVLTLIGCGPEPSTMPDDASCASSDDGGSRIDRDLLAVLADPVGPARLLGGSASLSSSREPEPPRGLRNNDHTHFVSVPASAGGRVVLADERGPGAITRMWLTFGGTGDPTDDDEVGRSARIHVIADGIERVFTPREHGVTLGELTSGLLAGLRDPWVLGPGVASGGFVIAVPLHYQESLRVELEAPADGGLLVYYQIDVRSFPEGTCVPGGASELHDGDALLESATALWSAHEHPGEPIVAERALGAGESIEHAVVGPGVITTIEVEAAIEARRDLEVTIEIDGAPAIEHADHVAPSPAARDAVSLSTLTGSVPPRETIRREDVTYAGALSSADVAWARLHAPIPFERSARVVVTNAGARELEVGTRLLVDRDLYAPELGRLRVLCTNVRVDVPYTITDPNRATETSATHRNVVLAAITGRGQYVGHTMTFWAPAEWWLGLENDHEVFVDGAYAVLGTGTEDYYGGAFYFKHGPFASPMSGATFLWPRHTDPGYETRVYRHHIADPIPFERELRFEVEPYLDDATWTGCSFFYMAR